MSFVDEFKEFAIKGNAVDMAVGIVVGAAFNKVVQSIVNDLLMPPLGMLIGGTRFENLKFILKPAEMGPDGITPSPEVAIGYGQFANTIIEFLIVSFTVFVVVKFMNSLIRKREAEEPAAAPAAHTP